MTETNGNGKRREILEAAQALFFEQGYDGTSVDAILERAGASKGTFYYHFDSKEGLLNELTKEMTEPVYALIASVVDEDLDALAKLNRFFQASGRWKAENRAMMQMMVRAFWREESVLLRHKLMAWATEKGARLLAPVLEQGKAEGVFDVDDPQRTAELIFQMGNGLGDSMAPLIISLDEHPENLDRLLDTVILYNRAVEKILGVPKGSIHMVEADDFRKVLLS